MSEPTREQPAIAPEVTTRSPWHVSRIPDHLGRARTSTVVLAVLFVSIFALYLYIRPATPGTATSSSGGGVQVPASTTAPAPRTTAPTTTPPGTTENQPTKTSEPTTPAGPTDTGTPQQTTPTPTPTRTSTPSVTGSQLPSASLSSPVG